MAGIAAGRGPGGQAARQQGRGYNRGIRPRPEPRLAFFIQALGGFLRDRRAMEAGGGIEPPVRDLQSRALPLCYPAPSRASPAWSPRGTRRTGF